jgi:hypothetical protein
MEPGTFGWGFTPTTGGVPSGAYIGLLGPFLTVAGWNVKGITPTAFDTRDLLVGGANERRDDLGLYECPDQGPERQRAPDVQFGASRGRVRGSSNTFDSYMKCASTLGTCGTAAPTLTPFPDDDPYAHAVRHS